MRKRPSQPSIDWAHPVFDCFRRPWKVPCWGQTSAQLAMHKKVHYYRVFLYAWYYIYLSTYHVQTSFRAVRYFACIHMRVFARKIWKFTPKIHNSKLYYESQNCICNSRLLIVTARFKHCPLLNIYRTNEKCSEPLEYRKYCYHIFLNSLEYKVK